MGKSRFISAVMLAIVGGAAIAASPAQASYYVRPVIQVGGGGTIDGYVANGVTASSQNFTSDFRSSVDLADGTVKSYLYLPGPGLSASVSGTFGDQVTFNSAAVGTTATFSFDFDGYINAGAQLAESTLQYGVFATLYVYEAGSGVTYANYGAAEFADAAVVSQSKFLNFLSPTEAFSGSIFDSVGGSFIVDGAGTYDVFVGLSLFATTNNNPVSIEMDFLNTGTLGIQTEAGATFTSASGVLLSNNGAPAVPEPSAWAMMIAGFGLIGGTLRRRVNLVAATC